MTPPGRRGHPERSAGRCWHSRVVLRPRCLLVVLAAAGALTGCSGQADTSAGPPPTPAAAPSDGRVTVRVGRAEPVRAEVADSAGERAVGLMRRTSVPPGTGMVFRYEAPSDGGYYMYDVPVPLTAVFARDGRVVGVIDMPPCGESDPGRCPTYAPGASYDTVLETAPETLRGKVAVGDALEVVSG